jgi:hypothetical protein
VNVESVHVVCDVTVVDHALPVHELDLVHVVVVLVHVSELVHVLVEHFIDFYDSSFHVPEYYTLTFGYL